MRRSAAAAIGTLIVATVVGGQAPPTIRVIALGGLLPIEVATRNGLFAKSGIDVVAATAPSSDALRRSLADGRADIAHAAVDNAVAMVEAGSDVVIVLGGEGTLNELIAQPGIAAIADLRGRTLIVDAPNTAYALQLKKLLMLNGIQPGRDCELMPVGATPQRLIAMRDHKEYAATMLGPPTSVIAKHEGFVSLGSAQKVIGAYQGIGAFVRREWARDHADALTRYLSTYVEAQRWLMNPAHTAQVIDLFAAEAHVSHDVAAEIYALNVRTPGGYAKDAQFDIDGFTNVLKLRAEVEGQWGGQVPPAQRYYDLTYYRNALANLKSIQ